MRLMKFTFLRKRLEPLPTQTKERNNTMKKSYNVIIVTYAPEKFGYNVEAYSHEQAAALAIKKLSRAIGETVDWKKIHVKELTEV